MAATLQYAKAVKVSLKEHHEFDEAWLRNVIAKDPSILGLGDLILKEAERMQPKAGRLDLLFQDPDEDKRYEVELMLGRVDESHIIRCIEYWDLERRKLPNYEHCAVLIAEEITARFFNVISLLNRAIPIIAIQLNALQLGESLVLNFTKVLDEALPLGNEEDEEELSGREVTDRVYWENKGSQLSLRLTDQCLEILREIDSTLTLTYNKHYIGLRQGNRPNNFVTFKPKKTFLRVEIRTSDLDSLRADLKAGDIEVLGADRKWGWLRIVVNDGQPQDRKAVLRVAFEKAYREAAE